MTALTGALSAMAGQVMLTDGVGGNTDPLRDGGIFNAAFQNPVLPGIKTYSLERNEGLAYGFWYDYAIRDAAVGGGDDTDFSTPGYDILSKGSAYVFETYGQAANSENMANAVQWAIWYLEDEFVYDASLTEAVLDAATSGLYSQYLNEALAHGGKANVLPDARVKVLNLSVSALQEDGLPRNLGLNRQDILIGARDLQTHVPEGGMTLLLLSVGLTGVGFSRRRLAPSAIGHNA